MAPIPPTSQQAPGPPIPPRVWVPPNQRPGASILKACQIQQLLAFMHVKRTDNGGPGTAFLDYHDVLV